jgi:hypothetical protein
MVPTECGVTKIQSFWRMYCTRKLYRETISRIQSDRKRTLIESIEENNPFVNRINQLSRNDFIQFGRNLIFKNFPGVNLENAKYYGRLMNQTITFKAKKDSIGRSCPISVRQHSKNSIYFVLNPSKQTVVVKCFSCDGDKELNDTTNILDGMRNKLVISEKEAKKTKTLKHSNLENLDDISIIKFDHSVLTVSEDVIMEFYNLHKFVLVAARKDKKSPVFSNWTTRTVEDNEAVNFRYNNIAIVCGEHPQSGIWVLDLDIKDDGLKWFQQLCSKHNYYYPKSTTCVKSPSGGIHLYYKCDSKYNLSNSVKLNCGGKLVGIDVRANSGCVIGPPSKYKIQKNSDDFSFASYEFICMKRPTDCPAFIYDVIMPRSE